MLSLSRANYKDVTFTAKKIFLQLILKPRSKCPARIQTKQHGTTVELNREHLLKSKFLDTYEQEEEHKRWLWWCEVRAF